MNRPRTYQYSLRRLLVLSTAVAALCAAAGAIPAPPAFQLGFGLYLAVLVAWTIMRLPAVSENWREHNRRRLAMIQRRREIAIETARAKAALSKSKNAHTGEPAPRQ